MIPTPAAPTRTKNRSGREARPYHRVGYAEFLDSLQSLRVSAQGAIFCIPRVLRASSYT